jgi:hypothetical protein
MVTARYGPVFAFFDNRRPVSRIVETAVTLPGHLSRFPGEEATAR